MRHFVLFSFQVIFLAARAAVMAPSAAPNLARAAPTPTTSWQPFPAFTPAPECSSLTISHRKRVVGIYKGCVGRDASCCPPGGSGTTYSPGRCPQGYTAQDAHVGLDPLGTDTVEWEATCVTR